MAAVRLGPPERRPACARLRGTPPAQTPNRKCTPRAACHYGDSEAEVEAGLRISSGAAFNRVLLFTLKEADGLLRRALSAPAAAGDGGAGAGAGGGAAANAATTAEVLKLSRWRKVGVERGSRLCAPGARGKSWGPPMRPAGCCRTLPPAL